MAPAKRHAPVGPRAELELLPDRLQRDLTRISIADIAAERDESASHVIRINFVAFDLSVPAQVFGHRAERARYSLVVCGEPGIGKSALCAWAAASASGMRVHAIHGVESEVDLPFAGLSDLCSGQADRLGLLPDPQARALEAALARRDATPSDRFAIGAALLSLLAVVAAEQPLLCWISEARWLDAASADALVFVARRLEREPIVLLFAAQEGQVRRFVAPGLPELHLRGLDAKAAAELLASRVGPLAPQVRDRLIDESGGNPLALLELPVPLTSQQLSGPELLPEPQLLTARLQQVFLQRFQGLPQATQTLLLVAAAEGAGELATISAAGQLLGVELAALTPAEEAGLVQVSGSHLRFRHPLVCLAIYQDASFAARQAAHRALLQVLGVVSRRRRRGQVGRKPKPRLVAPHTLF